MAADALPVWTTVPLNAETPLELLRRSEITPTELFFVRNHGPVPDVDPAVYRLRIEGDVRTPLALGLDELRRLPRATVTATLACAGNRRAELNRFAPVPNGVPW